jgi:hypothetical protein
MMNQMEIELDLELTRIHIPTTKASYFTLFVFPVKIDTKQTDMLSDIIGTLSIFLSTCLN